MRVRTLLFFIFSVILYGLFVNTVQAQVLQPGPIFTVNVTTGGDDGQCTDIHCTFEEAFNAANAFPAASTVNIPAGTYQLAANLPPLTRSDISIIGAGINNTVIEANNNNFFQTTALDTINNFVLRDLSINNPDTLFDIAGFINLDLSNVGIEGTVRHVYTDSSVVFNTLNMDGLQVDNVTASSALPLFQFNQSQFTLENSGFSNSNMTQLFDIVGAPTRTSFINNVTISGNTFGTNAGNPFAIAIGGFAETILRINHVTIADNNNFGFELRGNAAVAVLMHASILANNNFQGNPSDCELDDSSLGVGGIGIFSITTTIIPNNNCVFSAGSDAPITADPLLLPLADNTGDTLTHSFDPLSPALDGVACTLNRDQRGIARPQFALCDIGAFELTLPIPPTPVPPSPPQPQPTPQPLILFDPAISKIGFLAPGQTGLVGEEIEWVVTVQNVSSVSGINVVVSDTLIPELRLDNVSAPGGTVTINGNSFTVSYATLTPGQVVQFSIFTTVIRSVQGQILNTACVNADNQGAEECATGSVIATLPNTGEVPFWRNWVLAISGIVLLIGSGVALKQRKRKVA